MNEDTIRQSLQGEGEEKRRREKLLDAILAAFNSGGPEEAARRLEERMEDLKTEFDEQIKRLEEKL
jgi:hypothetical protein